jgi:hypothetical protein
VEVRVRRDLIAAHSLILPPAARLRGVADRIRRVHFAARMSANG